jgi:excisionase family DNA binding protein
VNRFSTLAVTWREEAERLRTLEANGQAAALELAARDLDAAVTSWARELLTISEAAAESGYTEEHLRRLAREGELPAHRNGGAKSRIKVRRGDLPTKRRKDGRGKLERVTYDPDEDARSIAQLLEARP